MIQKFRICVRVHRPAERPYDLAIRLYVDGRNFHSEIYDWDDDKAYVRDKVYMTGADGRPQVGKLQFAALVRCTVSYSCIRSRLGEGAVGEARHE